MRRSGYGLNNCADLFCVLVCERENNRAPRRNSGAVENELTNHPNRGKKNISQSDTEEAPVAPIVAFKGFDANMQCRGYQYKIGETYNHDGPVEACESGFHSVENPMDLFAYYEPATSLYAEVEASGEISRHDADSKIASARLHVKVALSIPNLIGRAIAWITAQCNPATSTHTDVDSSASSATGYSSASSATGYRSASSATGYSSASSATGYSSASSATGDRSASSATGDSSASSATGYRSASLATGYEGTSEILPHAENESLKAVAIATGEKGKVRAPAGSAIVLVERDENDGSILHIRASKIGDNGIKPDVWYLLKDGEFVEVEA